MSWKSAIARGKELVLATTDSTKPHGIVVISQGLFEGKLLIGACQMKTTIKNIKRNKNVCVVAKYKKEYYRIKGLAQVYTSGKYFDYSCECTKKGPYHARQAIAISIKEVFDLDNLKRIV